MAISDPNAFLKNDPSIIIGYGLTDNMNPNWKGPMPPEQANELIRQVNKLKEQNNHLNKYILELVKENETLQDRLSDMKVTLQENKAMMEEFMTAQVQIPSSTIQKEESNLKQEDQVKDTKAAEPSANDDVTNIEKGISDHKLETEKAIQDINV